MKTLPVPAWHPLSPEEALHLLETDPNSGLDEREVEQRRKRFGTNRLTRRPEAGRLMPPVRASVPLAGVLLIAAVMAGLLGNRADAGAILAVVLLHGLAAFILKPKVRSPAEVLAGRFPVRALALRNGTRQAIPAANLVPGDLVVLRAGDEVPADLRLLQADGLRLDESAVSGESVPVNKQTRALPAETALTDRTNLAFAATRVIAGGGLGIVVETGDRTQIGRIHGLMGEAVRMETPFARKLGRFGPRLTEAIIGVAAMALVVGFLRGDLPYDTLLGVIALVVAVIPVGLPLAVIFIRAIGATRMASCNAFAHRLAAVEVLGETTILCADKTGSLTANRMTVEAVYAGGQAFEFTGSGSEGEILWDGVVIDPKTQPALMECLEAGLLCTDPGPGTRDAEGSTGRDPIFAALSAAALKAGLHPALVAQTHPRLDAIPFESIPHGLATLHRDVAGDAHHAYIVGPVETLLPRCDTAFDTHLGMVALDRIAIHHRVDTFRARGLRVLAFARVERPRDDNKVGPEDLADGLTFLGLQGMVDPPRPEAVRVIAACRAAGIPVKMMTADHLDAAVALARRLALEEPHALHAMDGRALAAIPDEWLPDAIDSTSVFAGLVPEQKLRLVRALQAGGHVVAMLGDGVDDAPSLCRADLGIAMGRAGTAASREAADLVLMDDNLEAVPAAIAEGRGAYENILKFLAWALPMHLGQGLAMLAALTLDLTLPLLPTQILWINLTTAVFLGLVLGYEPKEPDLMNRPPRHPKAPLLGPSHWRRIGWVGCLLASACFGIFELELARGESMENARTAAMGVFVLGQAFYLPSLTGARRKPGFFSNRWLWAGISAMLLAQAALVYLPIGHDLFHTAPLGPEEWLMAATAGLVVYVLTGVAEWLRTGKARRPAAKKPGRGV